MGVVHDDLAVDAKENSLRCGALLLRQSDWQTSAKAAISGQEVLLLPVGRSLAPDQVPSITFFARRHCQS